MLPESANKIRTFMLVMLISGAVDSVRNLPATAVSGSSLIFYLFVSVLVFLIPIALVSAELSGRFDNKNGIYVWVKEAFGEKWGFFAVWMQWANTLVWYPTIFSFIAATATYLINPAWANNNSIMAAIVLVSFWALTLINLRGLKTSAIFATICTVLGVVIPITFIIGLGLYWWFQGNPLQIELSWNKAIPNFNLSDSWISLTGIITAFLGMELSAVHIHHINRPKITYPLAVIISAILIAGTMLLGSLAIALVIPSQKINLLNGVVEALNFYLQQFHLKTLEPLIIVLILLGSLGETINWIISPARGILQASDDGFLPKFFDTVNKHDVPTNILLLQAIIVSFICLLFLYMPSVNASFWLLTDLSTQLYILMYILMFIAAIKIGIKQKEFHGKFRIPGKNLGLYLTSILGLFGCFIAFFVGFIPPSNITFGSTSHYEQIFTLGLLLMMLPSTLFFWYKKNKTAKKL